MAENNGSVLEGSRRQRQQAENGPGAAGIGNPFRRKGRRFGMKKTVEDITAELSRLSREDRLEIAHFLLSLDDGLDPETASSWDDEITERVKAVEEGRARGIDYGEL
jgi:hypothetical protein